MKTLAQTEILAFLIELENAFNQAMVSNDVEQIARYITDDWILVRPEAGPIPGSRALGVIGSGVLTHATMTKVATHACVIGDVAWITGRGPNAGSFYGEPMAADEYITDIYRRVEGEWRCMLTHLTPAGGGPQPGRCRSSGFRYPEASRPLTKRSPTSTQWLATPSERSLTPTE